MESRKEQKPKCALVEELSYNPQRAVEVYRAIAAT